MRAGLERLLGDGALQTRPVRNALELAWMFHISRVALHFREIGEMRVGH